MLSGALCNAFVLLLLLMFVFYINMSLQWEEFMKLGNDTDDKIVKDKITAQKPEDYCTLVYTVSVLI